MEVKRREKGKKRSDEGKGVEGGGDLLRSFSYFHSEESASDSWEPSAGGAGTRTRTRTRARTSLS